MPSGGTPPLRPSPRKWSHRLAQLTQTPQTPQSPVCTPQGEYGQLDTDRIRTSSSENSRRSSSDYIPPHLELKLPGQHLKYATLERGTEGHRTPETRGYTPAGGDTKVPDISPLTLNSSMSGEDKSAQKPPSGKVPTAVRDGQRQQTIASRGGDVDTCRSKKSSSSSGRDKNYGEKPSSRPHLPALSRGSSGDMQERRTPASRRGPDVLRIDRNDNRNDYDEKPASSHHAPAASPSQRSSVGQRRSFVRGDDRVLDQMENYSGNYDDGKFVHSNLSPAAPGQVLDRGDRESRQNTPHADDLRVACQRNSVMSRNSNSNAERSLSRRFSPALSPAQRQNYNTQPQGDDIRNSCPGQGSELSEEKTPSCRLPRIPSAGQPGSKKNNMAPDDAPWCARPDGGDVSGNNYADKFPRSFDPEITHSGEFNHRHNYDKNMSPPSRSESNRSDDHDEESRRSTPYKYECSADDLRDERPYISQKALLEMNIQNNNLQYERRAIRLGFNPPIVYDIVPPPTIPKASLDDRRPSGKPRLGKDRLRVKTEEEKAAEEAWKKKKERWTRAKPPMTVDTSEYHAMASGSYFDLSHVTRFNTFPWFPVKVISETADRLNDAVHLARYPMTTEFRVIKDDYGKWAEQNLVREKLKKQWNG